MHVECSACGARYVIADDKIPIQGARVRCRKCQAVFSIERSASPTVAPPTPSELPLIPPTPQAPPPVSAPAAPPAFAPAPARPPAFDSSPFDRKPDSSPSPAPAQEQASPQFERFATAFSSAAPGAVETPAAAPSAPDVSRAPEASRAPDVSRAPSVSRSPAFPVPSVQTQATVAVPQGTGAPDPAKPGAVSPFSPSAGIPQGLPEAERLKHERARRLARVLASDIAIYNKEKRDRGIQEGNLVAVLGYEIKKSWEVYKERVTPEMANSTPYFRDALNEMLAEGKKVF